MTRLSLTAQPLLFMAKNTLANMTVAPWGVPDPDLRQGSIAVYYRLSIGGYIGVILG